MSPTEIDLIVDRIYTGSRKGNAADDPLPQLLCLDNGTGFRQLGTRPGIDTLKLLVLKSNFSDPDWPDQIDNESRLFTYYEDKKTARGIHNTPDKATGSFETFSMRATPQNPLTTFQ